MTTTLRVIVDQIVAPVPGGVGRYTEELTRQLIETAPRGCDVEGIISAVAPEELERVEGLLPGLTSLHRLPIPRRELTLAWQFSLPGTRAPGMVHAPSVLAPLHAHERGSGDQVAVTIHDTVPWTHPQTLTPRGVSWHKAMAKKAKRHADAIVVPTHAVAAELEEILGGLSGRLRVIGGAVSSKLTLPDDADERATALDLPPRYLLTVGTLEPRKGLAELIKALGEARQHEGRGA